MHQGQKKEIKFTFTPEEAKVIVSTAVFKFKDGEKTHQKILKMSGLGKFPFVHIDHDKLNFESMTVGKSDTKRIIMRNQSLVKAIFSIEKVSDDEKDRSFSLNETEGEIAPGSSRTIVVTYSPTMPGAFTCTQNKISILGGNNLKFNCLG